MSNNTETEIYSHTHIPGYITIIDNGLYTVTYSELTGDYIFLWADKELRR